MIYTEQHSNRNEQENWDISILLFKLDFNKFKQTHGHQKLEKPKKKKNYSKLDTVQTLTEKNIQNWKDLKIFLKKNTKIIYKYKCAVWDSKFGFGLNIVNIYDESITITITSAGLSKVE